MKKDAGTLRISGFYLTSFGGTAASAYQWMVPAASVASARDAQSSTAVTLREASLCQGLRGSSILKLCLYTRLGRCMLVSGPVERKGQVSQIVWRSKGGFEPKCAQ